MSRCIASAGACSARSSTQWQHLLERWLGEIELVLGVGQQLHGRFISLVLAGAWWRLRRLHVSTCVSGEDQLWPLMGQQHATECSSAFSLAGAAWCQRQTA